MKKRIEQETNSFSFRSGLFTLLLIAGFGTQIGCSRLSNSTNFLTDSSNWPISWDRQNSREQQSKDFLRKARELKRLGRDQEALKYAQQAEAKLPSEIDAIVLQGSIHRRLKQYPESIQKFQKAVNLDPNSQHIHLEYAQTTFQMEAFQETLNSIEKVLRTDPENIQSLRLKAESLQKLGRMEEAITEAYQILSILPNDAATKELLCKIYLSQNKPRRSWLLLQELIKNYPNEKLPANLRYLEFHTLRKMHRDADAALALRRWYRAQQTVDPLWTQCYQQCSTSIQNSVKRHLAIEPQSIARTDFTKTAQSDPFATRISQLNNQFEKPENPIHLVQHQEPAEKPEADKEPSKKIFQPLFITR